MRVTRLKRFRPREVIPGTQQNQGGATAAQSSAAFISADAAAATNIITLKEAVTLEELANDEEYADILEDMREECSKVGSFRVCECATPATGSPRGCRKSLPLTRCNNILRSDPRSKVQQGWL